jgi:multicomponent Na+:H+ antiporter subunit F
MKQWLPDIYISVCIAELVIIGVLFVRLWRGPSMSDRIVALNTMSTQSAIAVLFFAAYADRSTYVDVAMWLASFSYLGALVWARFLERGLL